MEEGFAPRLGLRSHYGEGGSFSEVEHLDKEVGITNRDTYKYN